MSALQLTALTKCFGSVAAVDRIDLTLGAGQLTAIVGPSGCGKSTLLYMLAGLEAPTGGAILRDGVRFDRMEPRDRRVGLVFQSYALYPHLSVLDNIRFPLQMMSVPLAEQDQRAHEAANRVAISELLSRKPAELSGGQQQRVALARAIVKQPELLLLDEPLSNLDAALRQTLRVMIRDLQRQLALTTVLVTHDQIEATTMADVIVVMNAGRIEQIGTSDDLYRRPANRFVANFIGSPAINFFDIPAGAAEHPLRYMVDEAPLRGICLGVRPEFMTVCERGIPGRIRAVEPMGREYLYTVTTAFGDVRVLRSANEGRFRQDEHIALDVQREDVLLFDAVSGKRLAHGIGGES